MQFSLLPHLKAAILPLLSSFQNRASSLFFSMYHGIHGVVVPRTAKLDLIVNICNMRVQCLMPFEAVLNDY